MVVIGSNAWFGFGWFDPVHDALETSLLYTRQRVGIAGEEPTTVGLFSVYRHTMPCEVRRFPAGARSCGQRVPAPRISDVADNHDLLQLAHAMDQDALVGARKAGGKSISAERRFARVKEYGIVRHQPEQADKIARVDGIDPDCVQRADFLFIRSHL